MSLDKLPYLIDEICAAVEIYYTGRQGSQYFKTAFILCDDYSELISKLFLLTDNAQWTDKKPNNHFKNYHEVLQEVKDVVSTKMPAQLGQLTDLQDAMMTRRNRRNEFFHSTSLLDLNISPRNCVETFCDLFAYGQLLFKNDWQKNVEASRNLDSMCALLQLEKVSFSDPPLWQRAMEIISKWPRNKSRAARTGVHMTEYPEDMHLRLCITHGGRELRDKLRALLTP